MESKAKFLGHAVHPIMIAFPLGLLLTGVVFDVIYMMGNNPTFATVAYWMIVSGVIGGFLAAVFGWIDWMAIPLGTRAKSVGLFHAVSNGTALLLFIGSWWLRSGLRGQPGTMAHVLSFAGMGLLLVGGWLGGELVERLGVGVDPGANLDAPNSLVHESASQKADSL